MKKFGFLLLTLLFSLSILTNAYAAPVNRAAFYINASKYTLNNSQQTMDAAPFIEDNRTYVPIRYLAYACGVAEQNIKWDNTFQLVTLTMPNTNLQLQVGVEQAIKNGLVENLDGAPIMRNGRTYLPARWIAEAFGYQVEWNEQSDTVSIYPPK